MVETQSGHAFTRSAGTRVRERDVYDDARSSATPRRERNKAATLTYYAMRWFNQKGAVRRDDRNLG